MFRIVNTEARESLFSLNLIEFNSQMQWHYRNLNGTVFSLHTFNDTAVDTFNDTAIDIFFLLQHPCT